MTEAVVVVLVFGAVQRRSLTTFEETVVGAREFELRIPWIKEVELVLLLVMLATVLELIFTVP